MHLDPNNSRSWAELGENRLDAGDIFGAREACLRALELDSACVAAHVTLGNVSIADKQLEAALECYRAALRLDPACHAARPNVASTLYLLGRHAEARTAFEETLRFEPANALAQHMLGALGGPAPVAAPTEYVKSLFDGYAESFDQHLVSELGYETPELIVKLVREVRPVTPHSLDVLDLGCGTGLAGAAIHSCARSLVGVDLAPRMLAVAARRKIYQRLHCGDLLPVLVNELGASFDVILAADVLVYIGRLEELIGQVRRVLRPGGIFAFSVEQLEARGHEQVAEGHAGSGGYAVNATGRYAHSINYLQRLSVGAELAVARQVECVLRTEQGRPVAGWIAAWVAPGGTQTVTLAGAMQRAQALYASGERTQAEQLCRWVLESNGSDSTALSLLGVIAAQTQRLNEAAALLGQALAMRPEDPEAHYNRGTVFQQLDRHHEALASYSRTLELAPDHAAALYNRAAALQNLGRLEEALESYDRAVKVVPDFAEAYNNRGNILQDFRRHLEALDSYECALRARPDFADAHNNRGITLTDLGRHEEALDSYARALDLDPNYAEAHNNLGTALHDLRRCSEALISYERALQIRPDYAEAHNNRGNALQDLERYEDAIPSYERALRLHPDYPWLHGQWLNARMRLCDWRQYEPQLKALLSAVATGKRAASPYVLLGFTDSLPLQRRAAEIWMKQTCPPAAEPGSAQPCATAGVPLRGFPSRIRVAYVSGDFRDHPVSQLLSGVLERHDRERFEVIAVGLQPPDHSALGQRIRRAADQFIDVSRQSDESVAQWLRHREVDIVVDLQGITQGMRAEILSRRPARIQVNYLGFPATMGASYIDYIIGDEVVIPPGAEEHYSESVVRLPHTFLPFDDTQGIAEELPTREQAGLPAGGFVFCDFNNHIKITPGVFEVWMRWLLGIPGSCLWLRWAQEKVQENLRREAQARGVAGERIVFAGKVPTLEEHLSRQRLADLFVDTLPYNAHATAAQALWAGVPLLTCQGASFAGRVASSLLTAVGLPELITPDLSAYERVGFELARAPQRLKGLRDHLAARSSRSTSRERPTRARFPLFDTATYTRHLEAAYQLMIERHRHGLPPAHLNVSQ